MKKFWSNFWNKGFIVLIGLVIVIGFVMAIMSGC